MEFMANIERGVDEQKPSLFELLSEQQLAELLPPSLRYLLALATHRHPRYLLGILNSFDEVYALLMLAVERHFLKTYGGSFTENFYGLKRERVLRVKGGQVPRAQLGAPSMVREALKLREADIWRNLAVGIGVPYLKRKLDESYDIHVPSIALVGPTYNRDTLPPAPSFRPRLLYYYKWFLRNVYPSINAAYYFSLVLFNLSYLFDGTKYHSPFLWLIGTRMRRLGEADYRAIQAITDPSAGAAATAGKSPRPGQANSLFNPRIFFSTIYPKLLSSLRILLPTSVFALRFLEWWHASDFARQLSRKAAEGLELPPPIISAIASPAPPPSSSSPQGSRAVSSSSASSSNSLPSSTFDSADQQQFTASPTTRIRDPKQPPPLASAQKAKPQHPISSISQLAIFTVPQTAPADSDSCPICRGPIVTPTASPYGFVYCYVCIHKWVEGKHERQEQFMQGGGGEEEKAWGADGENGNDPSEKAEAPGQAQSREDKWESGKGRCAVSGKRILGGTEVLRRVVA